MNYINIYVKLFLRYFVLVEVWRSLRIGGRRYGDTLSIGSP
jgi:hypothetical protein